MLGDKITLHELKFLFDDEDLESIVDMVNNYESLANDLESCCDRTRRFKEECDTLKARVDELEEIIENSEEEYSDMDADAQHWMEQYHSIKQDALLGKALKKAFEYNFEVYKSQGCIVVETNTHDIELLDWYQQQLEKEETSGK